ncbi:hypothetical protein QF117_10550 [Vibrio sp. YMD68]|uniref:hypothetical protein n=1 Tax=Vibrio sp. YMD68 TaxID=3042300 RepID=UPI00249C4527|nr:hypothetical protein [Vibrio sp. YMD68]WGV98844.1 hypothetical protein QF117_02460 [Vibrio sp. YMD68]WGW01229.1 hypothetical protein QF117_10550 [Vibrio sp. YMD68]
MTRTERVLLMLEHSAVPMYLEPNMNLDQLLKNISFHSEHDRAEFLSRLALLGEHVAFMPKSLTPEMRQAREHVIAHSHIATSIRQLNEQIYQRYVDVASLSVSSQHIGKQ